MDWKLLQINICPKCEDILEFNGGKFNNYLCLNKHCDFKISRERYIELTRETNYE